VGYRPGRIWLGGLETGRSPVKNEEFKGVIVHRDFYFDYEVTVEFIPTWDAQEITSHVAEFATKDMEAAN
jgi:hypothetical protein